MKFFAIATAVTAATTPIVYGSFRDASANAVSPLTSCGSSSDVFTPTDIVLTPYPIKIGQPLQVTATGTLSAPINNGSTITVSVKEFGITLFSKTEDFCSQASQANKTCPIAPGPQAIQASQPVPTNVPAGTYNVEIKLNDPSKAEIACLSGSLQFSK
ncbi:Phosphatidylglycerol/phosphatidylinositol transfer protein [Boothiomyces sp. JEL0838]|nr:Phosphatidylglycerol/phosphatidylinositol transfer protein [Boothiomyces sp. JEL0838]